MLWTNDFEQTLVQQVKDLLKSNNFKSFNDAFYSPSCAQLQSLKGNNFILPLHNYISHLQDIQPENTTRKQIF